MPTLGRVNPTSRVFSWPGVALVVSFPVLWILAESTQRDKRRQSQVHQDGLDFAASDFTKSVLSLSIWFACRKLQGARSFSSVAAVAASGSPEISDSDPEAYNLPLHDFGQELYTSGYCGVPYPRIIPFTLGNARSTLVILAVSCVYTLRAYIDAKNRESVDPFTLHLAFPLTVLGILTVLRIISWRNFPSPYWHAAVLQFSGFFIARDAIVGSALPPCSLLVASALCNSIWISLVDVIYRLHRSPSIHLINAVMFAQSCLVHSLLFLLHPSRNILHSYHDPFMHALQALPLIEAVKDIVAISIIYQYGAIGQGILASLASTFLIAVDTWKLIEPPYSGFLGCLIAILGSGIFVLYRQYTDEQRPDFLISGRRCFAAAMISLVALGHVVVVISQASWPNSSDLSFEWGKTPDPSGNRSDCRVPEPSNVATNYTRFSNVLLVVFFSHARYDANLDFHREVYADYFPNIVYIGPATREDKGFTHSYDVLVDSFQSEEDLSDPLFYRMAGRMAHHMLYTALREYGCFDGYLWVPFDTLLNVPRLQQFNQSLFWYHSPWGKPVPNPAHGDLAEPWLSVGRHAPPAMISPDPSVNLTETWRGWGPDWWWGDPHVGVSVCMNAFRKVPEEMRAHLAQLTNGQTRLIGGSADTLYIPGRHRKAFMDVLALFLETDCFLEIATPTTVHLVVPPGEPIQFVDHWWIYQPPFNASFVRQKWAEGYEVDTFHTFHWGERGEDGVWQGDHRHVADVRHLQRESAIRQGMGDTFPVNLVDDDDEAF